MKTPRIITAWLALWPMWTFAQSGEKNKFSLVVSAKYDAAGNAGIINIRTKKNRNDGFNGTLTTTYGQGVYPKYNNSLVLNYRKGRLNSFFNYSLNDIHYLTDLYAYRKYYDDGKNVTAILQQPTYFSGTVVNHTLKTGLDYSLSPGTTVGLVLTGTDIHRDGNNTAHANWLQPGIRCPAPQT